ncbi:hypothetical protein [Traorella massiliensis]|uniref:hypothetical protein n=1 Tax=Traorella massiliensis TaxID=1903263 RepID=UPI00248EE934|nr:hypothetical protein [Traorella massiliensis]
MRITIKKKRIYIILAIFFILLGMYSTYLFLSPEYYLSFVTIETDEKNGEGKLNFYYENLSENESQKLLSVPYSASCPVGVYDLKNNCIYYSDKQLKEGEQTSNDKVVRYDCSLKKSEVIIKDLNCINDMYLRNDGTLVIIAKKGEDTNIQPYLYNFSDNSIESIVLDGDMCFESNYNPYDDEFIFCGYSDAEYREMLEKYNKEQNIENQSDYNIDNNIYLFKKNINLSHSFKTGNIPVIVKDSEKIIYGKCDGFFSEHLSFEILENNKREPLSLDESILNLISLRKDKLICVASSRNCQGIYEYDLNEKKFTKSLFFDPDESIYSAHLVKK